MPRLRLRSRLLLSYLVVIVVGAVTVFVAVGLVAPGALEAAMGHSMPGMDDMMSSLVQSAFQSAVQSTLLVGVIVAATAGALISLALTARLSAPVAGLVAASRRIAAGRYAERVPVPSADEIGELAGSFNQMAEALESTERRRLQLVGDVAHELRTPLTTLDGYLEGLQDGVVQPDEATWQLLRRETGRLSHLINDLQELWRAEARQLPLSIATVDVQAELAALHERFATQAAASRIVLAPTPPSRGLTLRADRDRLAQILDNFVSNAIRYVPSGTRVTLSAGREGDEVAIAVSDQGPGLTDEQREQVFDRFYRVDPSRSRALGGAGIGLAIARALAGAMGGRVEALSEGPGRGATFRVILPAD